MRISEQLLEEMSSWMVKPVPGVLYHGCRKGDRGIDLDGRNVTGPKWFSIDPYYAGEYAWHWSRPGEQQPWRLQVTVKEEQLAVECPDKLEGEKWAQFLAKCFPEVHPGYQLSHHFQKVIALHLKALNIPKLNSYMSGGGQEVCIPNSQEIVRVKRVVDLPPTKDEYVELNGLC